MAPTREMIDEALVRLKREMESPEFAEALEGCDRLLAEMQRAERAQEHEAREAAQADRSLDEAVADAMILHGERWGR